VSSRARFGISLLVVVLIGLTRQALSEDQKQHLLVVDYPKTGLVYTVDGRVPSEKEGLLLALSRARSNDPAPDAEIVVLVDERVTFSDVYNLSGIVVKAGYSAYRVFTFDGDKKIMIEVKYAPPVPFSATGSIPERDSSARKP
jgi:biopolymer transport protein ExbD